MYWQGLVWGKVFPRRKTNILRKLLPQSLLSCYHHIHRSPAVFPHSDFTSRISGRGNRIRAVFLCVCVCGFVGPTLCTTSTVQSYIDLCCAPPTCIVHGEQGGPTDIMTSCHVTVLRHDFVWRHDVIWRHVTLCDVTLWRHVMSHYDLMWCHITMSCDVTVWPQYESMTSQINIIGQKDYEIFQQLGFFIESTASQLGTSLFQLTTNFSIAGISKLHSWFIDISSPVCSTMNTLFFCHMVVVLRILVM